MRIKLEPYSIIGPDGLGFHCYPNKFEYAGDTVPLHCHENFHAIMTDKPLRVRGLTNTGEPYDRIYPATVRTRLQVIWNDVAHELIAMEDDTVSTCIFIARKGQDPKGASRVPQCTSEELREMDIPLKDLR